MEFRDQVPMQRMSEYQEWVEGTAFNLNHSAKARARSRKIIQRLINSTRDMAQLMRQEAINVDNTLKDSIKNWTEWRDAIQAQLSLKEKEMKTADAAITEIQVSLKLNGSPLQVSSLSIPAYASQIKFFEGGSDAPKSTRSTTRNRTVQR